MGVCSSNETQIRVITTSGVESSGGGGASGRFKSTVTKKFSHTLPKLEKRDSNMNLIPQELHKLWFQSDESKFEREKHLLVLCPNTNPAKASRVVIVDVDYQSLNYGKVVSYLTLPKPGDDLIYACWPKNSISPGENSTPNPSFNRNLIVVPCMNTSRIYVLAIEEDTLQLKLRKYINSEELGRWNLASPLSVCNGPGRSTAILICTMADDKEIAKGDIFRLDRRLYTIERRINEPTVDYKRAEVDSTTYMPSQPKAAAFGGSIALLVKQGILFSTEWGEIKRMNAGFRCKLYKNEDDLYGCCINVWDVQKKRMLQTLCLDKIDGRMTVCIRLLHHVELIHGYVCAAIGGCIYHLHKNSKTGFFSADRVLKFPSASVEGWLESEVTAFPCDMVISMDDDYLFIACWLHGIITQYDITDPFKPTLTHKIFLGGVIHPSLGVDLLDIACADFTPTRRTICGKLWEGGPAKLQLSLDGRRLYVTNSFYRPWDSQIYPNLIRTGSSIALVRIDYKSGVMKWDEQFGIFFDKDSTHKENEQFLAREMKFLNGNSSSDALW